MYPVVLVLVLEGTSTWGDASHKWLTTYTKRWERQRCRKVAQGPSLSALNSVCTLLHTLLSCVCFKMLYTYCSSAQPWPLQIAVNIYCSRVCSTHTPLISSAVCCTYILHCKKLFNRVAYDFSQALASKAQHIWDSFLFQDNFNSRLAMLLDENKATRQNKAWRWCCTFPMSSFSLMHAIHSNYNLCTFKSKPLLAQLKGSLYFTCTTQRYPAQSQSTSTYTT